MGFTESDNSSQTLQNNGNRNNGLREVKRSSKIVGGRWVAVVNRSDVPAPFTVVNGNRKQVLDAIRAANYFSDNAGAGDAANIAIEKRLAVNPDGEKLSPFSCWHNDWKVAKSVAGIIPEGFTIRMNGRYRKALYCDVCGNLAWMRTDYESKTHTCSKECRTKNSRMIKCGKMYKNTDVVWDMEAVSKMNKSDGAGDSVNKKPGSKGMAQAKKSGHELVGADHDPVNDVKNVKPRVAKSTPIKSNLGKYNPGRLIGTFHYPKPQQPVVNQALVSPELAGKNFADRIIKSGETCRSANLAFTGSNLEQFVKSAKETLGGAWSVWGMTSDGHLCGDNCLPATTSDGDPVVVKLSSHSVVVVRKN